MIQAYAQIIPPQVRVIHLGLNQTETSSENQKPRQDSRAERVGKECSQSVGSNRPQEYFLVIDPITKKEVA
jgi:hypothetical protein